MWIFTVKSNLVSFFKLYVLKMRFTWYDFGFQVVAPGDVAFNLGGNSNATAESVVIETTNRNDADGICMSVSSFVGGLVMLLLLLVVASLVAAFLFVRVRSIHKKTAIFANGFDNPDYLKHQTGAN